MSRVMLIMAIILAVAYAALARKKKGDNLNSVSSIAYILPSWAFTAVLGVESKSNPGSSFTAYYHGGGSNLQVSTTGCRDCVMEAHDFLDEAVQKALKESMEEIKPKDDTPQEAIPPVEGVEENVSDTEETESTETDAADGDAAETTPES